LVHDKERTLVANLAAALKFPTHHITDNISVLERSTMLYSTCFFITANFDALIEVGKHAEAQNKPFGLNLSACFLLEFETAKVVAAMEYADFIFCNEDEAACYAKVVLKNEGATNEQVAKEIASSKKLN
jgi:adenosine kinase